MNRESERYMMNKTKILAVDKSIANSEQEQAAWLRHGYSTIRVNSMQEAIELLTKETFLYIAINGDNINYMPLLSVMRDTTNTLIFIIDSDHTADQEIEALHSGADVYATFSGDAETNIQLALALLSRHSEREKQLRIHTGMLIYERFLVMSTSRQIFLCDEKLKLTSMEYDFLHYFILNHDHSLSYSQIYRKVWRRDVDGDSHRAIWNFINKIRRKIEDVDSEHEYFYIERDYGYRFTALRDKKDEEPGESESQKEDCFSLMLGV